MNKLNLKFLAFFLFIVFLSVGVLGTFNYNLNNLHTSYSAGDKIKGFFNISFNDEPADSKLTSNFPGGLKLLDFLESQNNNLGNNFTCSTPNCENDYSVQGQTSGILVQGNNENEIVGFKLSGSNVHINSVDFKLSSNVLASCSNQLTVDILNDGQDLILNTDHDGETCGIKHFGCYDNNIPGQATIRKDREFCEAIELPVAPAFFVGAKVQNSTMGYSPLEMTLYNSAYSKVGDCILPKHTQNVEDLKCIINYSSFETDTYYACIASQDNFDYKIGWETSGDNCGTIKGGSGEGFTAFNNDFDIFAESVKFGATPFLEFSDSSKFDDYLLNTYGRDCQTFDCVFPIGLFGQEQFFQLLDLIVEYEVSGGIVQTNTEFYELDLDEALINSGELKLDLEKANFEIPIGSGENKFELFIGGNSVFEENISIVNSFTFDVNPRLARFGEDTTFTIISNENISETTWNFGDGSSPITVSGRQINHMYVEQNGSLFDLVVDVKNSENITATKSFGIFIGNPRELANETILLYGERIINITDKIGTYPLWLKLSLENELGISDLQSKLLLIETAFSTSITDEDFQNVMLDLIDLNFPKELKNLKENSKLPLAITSASINVNYIEKISNKDISNNAELKASVISWMVNNFDSELSYEHIAKFSDFDSEVILSKFKIETKPSGSISDKTYLIFGQNIETAGKFKENYDFDELTDSGVSFIELDTSNNQVFEFFIKGEINPEELGSYISLEVNNLPLDVKIVGECNLDGVCSENEDSISCPEDCSTKAFKFTLIGLLILLFLAFAIYIILQEWYKRNYQKSLFPRQDDLYNLINFIYNGRKSGLNDSQISKKLKDSGWKSEKISFALRKINGKRTGMFEIPLFKFFENKKIENEISIRQPNPIEKRFVRRQF